MINIAWVILDTLLDVPDRIIVAQNLILSGGLFMIPGFKRRVIEEMHHAIDNIDKYSMLSPLKKYIKIEK